MTSKISNPKKSKGKINKLKRTHARARSQKNNKIFKGFGIDGNEEHDRKHRRDFWIVLMILCLILTLITYSKLTNYLPREDYSDEFPPKQFIITPNAKIVENIEDCKNYTYRIIILFAF